MILLTLFLLTKLIFLFESRLFMQLFLIKYTIFNHIYNLFRSSNQMTLFLFLFLFRLCAAKLHWDSFTHRSTQIYNKQENGWQESPLHYIMPIFYSFFAVLFYSCFSRIALVLMYCFFYKIDKTKYNCYFHLFILFFSFWIINQLLEWHHTCIDYMIDYYLLVLF